MAKTNSERQKDYRLNRQLAGQDGNGEHQLNMWLSTAATLALNRLAVRYSVTKKGMLEKLILEKDSRVAKSFENDEKAWEVYQSARKNEVSTKYQSSCL